MPCKFESREAYVKAVELSQPLYEAVIANDLAQVRSLISQGARVEYCVDDGGFRKSMLTIAVEKKIPQMIRLLCTEYNCSPNDKAYFSMGEPPLHVAARYAVAFKLANNRSEYQNCVDCINVLLDSGAQVDYRLDAFTTTALDIAKRPDPELHDMMLLRAQKIQHDINLVEPLVERVVGDWLHSIFEDPDAKATPGDAGDAPSVIAIDVTAKV